MKRVLVLIVVAGAEASFADAKHPNPFLSQAKAFFAQGDGDKCLKRLIQAEQKWKHNDKHDRADIELYGGMCGYLMASSRRPKSTSATRLQAGSEDHAASSDAGAGIENLWAKVTGKPAPVASSATPAATPTKAKKETKAVAAAEPPRRRRCRSRMTPDRRRSRRATARRRWMTRTCRRRRAATSCCPFCWAWGPSAQEWWQSFWGSRRRVTRRCIAIEYVSRRRRQARLAGEDGSAGDEHLVCRGGCAGDWHSHYVDLRRQLKRLPTTSPLFFATAARWPRARAPSRSTNRNRQHNRCSAGRSRGLPRRCRESATSPSR